MGGVGVSVFGSVGDIEAEGGAVVAAALDPKLVIQGGGSKWYALPPFQLWLPSRCTEHSVLPRIAAWQVFGASGQWARSRLIGGVACTTRWTGFDLASLPQWVIQVRIGEMKRCERLIKPCGGARDGGAEAMILGYGIPHAIQYWQQGPWAIAAGAQDLQLPVNQFMLVIVMHLLLARQGPRGFALRARRYRASSRITCRPRQALAYSNSRYWRF